MANKTPNYNLTKPLASEFYDVEVQNGNMDIIDTQMKALDGKSAPAKTSIADADTLPLHDSADSNKLKKITWANIKAVIGNAFAPKTHSHAATDITGTLSSDRLPTVPVEKGGTGATNAANARSNLGITPANIGASPSGHTHNYAGSSSAGGAATSAVKLQTARTLTIGNSGKTFDGSADVSWTADEIGVSKESLGLCFTEYTELSEIGLTKGSETIESIGRALPNQSRLVTQINNKNNTAIYPFNHGTLRVTRLNQWRIFYEFIRDDDTDAAVVMGIWYMTAGITGVTFSNSPWYAMYGEHNADALLAGAAKVATGSYAGTNETTKTFTFDFQPKFFCLLGMAPYDNIDAVYWVYGATKSLIQSTNIRPQFTVSGNTLSVTFNSSNYVSINASGTTYYYVAIG